MEKITATDAKNKFGELLYMAQSQPVFIEKKGRPVAIILSLQEFSRLEEMEDLYWAIKADRADKESFLSSKESENFLDNLGK